MAEVVVFPDVEAMVCDYLRDELFARGQSVLVASRAPASSTITTFVRVFRTGGVDTNLVMDQAQITVETWAQAEPRAVELAQLCRGLLRAADVINGVQVYRVEPMSAPQNLPDPGTNRVRYTATYAVSVRGVAA